MQFMQIKRASDNAPETLRGPAFVATRCDGCGKAHRGWRHTTVLEFQPEGSDWHAMYTLCPHCLDHFHDDPAIRSNAVSACMARCPEMVEYAIPVGGNVTVGPGGDA